MLMLQGKRANSNGRYAEDLIADTLIRRGYTAKRQYPIGESIFGTKLFADFYLASVPPFPNGLIIESKWQEVGGSAEEKLCYLVENIQFCYPCPVIVVIDGGGFRSGAVRWLRSKAGQGRLFAVLNVGEFMKWCNQKL
jgi:hypothetical protein